MLAEPLSEKQTKQQQQAENMAMLYSAISYFKAGHLYAVHSNLLVPGKIKHSKAVLIDFSFSSSALNIPLCKIFHFQAGLANVDTGVK